MNTLPPEVIAQINARQAEQRREDEAGKRAAVEPLPGPLRDVFALQPNIKVGPYEVRPFYDIDFEWLSLLKHPLYEMMMSSMNNAAPEQVTYMPRGPQMWTVAWIMTRSPDEVEAKITQGEAAVASAAKAEFSRLQLPALAQLSAAIMAQMGRYWAPVVEYGAEEGEKSPNPPRALPAT